jgi:molybdopterin converting factor small subunit
MPEPATTVKIIIELFGTPRLRAGRREVELELPATARRQQVIQALAQVCPALVGQVLLEDLSGLQEGYVFNLNGTAFLSGDIISVQPGDSLLLLSNQAGG